MGIGHLISDEYRDTGRRVDGAAGHESPYRNNIGSVEGRCDVGSMYTIHYLKSAAFVAFASSTEIMGKWYTTTNGSATNQQGRNPFARATLRTQEWSIHIQYAEGADAEPNLDDGHVSRGALWWLNDFATIFRNKFSTRPSRSRYNPFLIDIAILPVFSNTYVEVSENGDNNKNIKIQGQVGFVGG
jgi:hypothetical protein